MEQGPKKKHNLVIDTNVLLGDMWARLAPRDATPADRVDHDVVTFALKFFTVCQSEATQAEFARMALGARHGGMVPSPQSEPRQQHVAQMTPKFELCAAGRSQRSCTDRNDQMFLHLAAGASAHYIISRDRHLLSVPAEGKRRILTPDIFFNEVIRPKRIVIDTNVFYGAMRAELEPENARAADKVDLAVVKHAFANFEVCATVQTMAELERVCFDPNQHKEQLPATAYARNEYVRKMLQSNMRRVEPMRSRLQCNSKDQMFLDAAAGAGAAFVVSRDQGVIFLQKWNRGMFYHPEAYMSRFAQSGGAGLPAPQRHPPVKKATIRHKPAYRT